jgi:predicted glycosyl hydrolase (DUF1957 family)
MLWLNFIHLYQPANMERAKLLEATEKSYERILRALEEHPGIRMTANISASLLERWATDLERMDIIERFKKAVKKGQLELVGSAAYHALLPLVSPIEALEQIREQEAALKKYFGLRKPQGFYLPEMAYSPEVARLIKKAGYGWLIVDEITVFGRTGESSNGVFYDLNSGLKAVARNRFVSESYVPDTLNELIAAGINEPIITATDAELYGLRHIDHTAEFEKIIKLPHLKTQTISRYINTRKEVRRTRLVASNWQTTEMDLLKKTPFSLWADPKNAIHGDLWALADLAQLIYQSNRQDPNAWWSRWHLWRGLQSCSWWWASKNDFRTVFGPLAWSPDEVEKGVNELIRSIRSLESSTDKKTKIKAEKLAQKIRADVWIKHWQ